MNSRILRIWALGALFTTMLIIAGCDQSGSAGDVGDSRALQAAQRTSDQSAPARNPNAAPPTRTAPTRDRTTAPPQQPQPAAQAGTNLPPIEFDPPELDFGIVKPNSSHNQMVYIQNISDRPLLIERTKASCTCTTVDLANTPLGPGERVGMRLDFHSSIITGPKTSGVRVFVKGYDYKEYTLKAIVTLPISVEPPFINGVSDTEGNVPRKGEYTLKSLDGKPFHVLRLNHGTPKFIGFDPAKDEYRNTYVMTWDFTEYALASCLNSAGEKMPGSIAIETDHPDCPVIDIEIRAECSRRAPKKDTDSWYIQDKRVLAGSMKDGEWHEFQLLAKWYPKITSKDPVIATESLNTQFITELVRVEPEKDGFVVHFRVKPTPGHRGLVYADMVFKSNREQWPVTVVGSVR